MNARPLIVHVLYRLDTGGMERVVVSLINATHDRYRHAVIALTGCGALRHEIEHAVTACVSLGKKPGKDWSCYFRFWRALRALKPDLVQTYNIGTLDLAPLVKLAGVRRLVHAEHGRDAADPHGDNRTYHRLRRWMAPLVERYVAVSPDLRAWLTQRVGIRSSKVTYIANGIDTVPFDVPRLRFGARTLLGGFAPPGTMLVGNVARLDKVKDHAGLLLAFKLLREECESGNAACRLIIAGDGPQRGELEQQIVRLGLTETVRLLGNRSDVAQLLAECDVFALSSVAEGMPITLLEAMAAGLPVVATDVGGVASVIEDGVTGTLVPPGDPHALAAALHFYVADEPLRRRHGDAGRARVAAHFSLRSMVSAYVALYDELLGRQTNAVQPRMVSGLTGHKEN
ncbi:sugar transferase [Rhodanobacter thiooxydans]|uniref:Sugar transferase n=1 Tax=Rhodanobacter thiooxydans TaxID=416169 RepID=A0A154QCS7_9GAMM|nr:TIGR03088 family PEP-CTERM/XrtA system glycosyltransferase [Rhodanobacter thiooxydans]EIM02179.1 sugar transferase [Rhodanobacter thiooxydans LCS2]KZC22024.1 sugar transferase [Rhodanobacter thiooxydans]MCW0200491.1 TIGR03088 family PEP-CTERM/XrtA system glycosyltransferase [Rhodanobacter thiooxydans]